MASLGFAASLSPVVPRRSVFTGLGVLGAPAPRVEAVSPRHARRAPGRSAVITMSGVHKAVKAKAIKEHEIDPAADILEDIAERHMEMRGADIADAVDKLGRDLIRPRSQAYGQVIAGPYHKKMNMVRYLVANLATEMTSTDAARTIYAFSLMNLDPREDVWQELVARFEEDFEEVPDVQFVEGALGMLRTRRYLSPNVYARFLSFPFRLLFEMPPVYKLVAPTDIALLEGEIDASPAPVPAETDDLTTDEDPQPVAESDEPQRETVSSIARSRKAEYNQTLASLAPEIPLEVERIPSEIAFFEYLFWTTPRPPRRKIVRQTAWQSESGIALKYHDREFTPSPLTITSKKLRRTLFEKTGIFFDSVLVQFLKHGGCGTGFQENWPLEEHRENFTDNVAITFVGCTRQVALAPRDALVRGELDEAQRIGFHLFEGDIFVTTAEGLENFTYRIPPESKRYFADDSCSFTFFQSKEKAALGDSLIEQAGSIDVRSSHPLEPHQLDQLEQDTNLTGLNIVRSVYSKQQDIEFAYEPLTPSTVNDFKRSFGQIPDLVDSADEYSRELLEDETVEEEEEEDSEENLDEFFG